MIVIGIGVDDRLLIGRFFTSKQRHELGAKSRAREKIQKEIANVVQIEEEMSETGEELVQYGIAYVRLGGLRGEKVVRLVQIVQKLVALLKLSVKESAYGEWQIENYKAKRHGEQHDRYVLCAAPTPYVHIASARRRTHSISWMSNTAK